MDERFGAIVREEIKGYRRHSVEDNSSVFLKGAHFRLVE